MERLRQRQAAAAVLLAARAGVEAKAGEIAGAYGVAGQEAIQEWMAMAEEALEGVEVGGEVVRFGGERMEEAG